MNIEHAYAGYVDDKGVARIRALEKETGMRIMAFNTPSVPGKLSPDQLSKIQELEKKLCVRLVAYENH